MRSAWFLFLNFVWFSNHISFWHWFFQSINLNLELFEGFKPFLFCFFCSFSIGSLVFIKTGLKRRIQLQFLSSKKRRSKDQKKTCNFSISSSGVGPFALGILILCPSYLHIMILFKFQTVVQFFLYAETTDFTWWKCHLKGNTLNSIL